MCEIDLVHPQLSSVLSFRTWFFFCLIGGFVLVFSFLEHPPVKKKKLKYYLAFLSQKKKKNPPHGNGTTQLTQFSSWIENKSLIFTCWLCWSWLQPLFWPDFGFLGVYFLFVWDKKSLPEVEFSSPPSLGHSEDPPGGCSSLELLLERK